MLKMSKNVNNVFVSIIFVVYWEPGLKKRDFNDQFKKFTPGKPAAVGTQCNVLNFNITLYER